MKQSLQLRLGQHLTMTPQLQQAIRLLQLSTLELQTEVQQALESNPLLELTEEGEGEADVVDLPGGEGKSGEGFAHADRFLLAHLRRLQSGHLLGELVKDFGCPTITPGLNGSSGIPVFGTGQ